MKTKFSLLIAAALFALTAFSYGQAGDDVKKAADDTGHATKTAAKRSVKKVTRKRRPLSPEARAKLAKNLVKARAARARNLKAAKRATRKRAAKKVGRPAKKRPTKRA